MCSTVTLPLELVDMVLDNLHPADSDWDASWPMAEEVRQPLSACTLVSRSWYPFAQGHLFRDVVYSFQHPLEEGLAAWSALCSDKPQRWVSQSDSLPQEYYPINRLPLKTLQMFADFLHQSPHLKTSIRKLRLANYFPGGIDGKPWPWMWGNGAWGSGRTDPTLFTILLASLPRLQHFQPWNIFMTPRLSSTPPISVRRLRITYGYIRADTVSVCTLLAYVGKVDELAIEEPSWAPTGVVRDRDRLVDRVPPSVSLDVRSLTISKTFDDPPLLTISELLSRSPFVRNLSRLTLDNTSLMAVNGVDTMMAALGTHLEYFKLTLYDPGMIDLFSRHLGGILIEKRIAGDTGFIGQTLDLSPMTALRELVIGMTIKTSHKHDRRLWTEDFVRYFRTTILSPRKNPNLRKIGFHFGRSGRHQGCDAASSGDHWWQDPDLRLHIFDFETHFANILVAFGFDGMYLECHDDGVPPGEVDGQSFVQHFFEYLAQENLIKFDVGSEDYGA